MLVLSRKTNEAIFIGSNITITVLGVRGGKVRLGLKAPPEVPILRSELRKQICAEEFECEAQADYEPIA